MEYRYVGSCPRCGQGLLLIVRDKLAKKLMLICDDCEHMWSDPIAFFNKEPPISDDAKVDLDNNVSDEEIIAAGWEKHVKNMGT
jgi:hypothetical protein